MARIFDAIVVGGGPGGYAAAVRAAELGLRTAVVEREVAGHFVRDSCLSARRLFDGAQLRGAPIPESRHIEELSRRSDVELVVGSASLTPDGDVRVGEDVHRAKAVILATGSVARPIPGVPFGLRIVDSWGAWGLAELPGKIAVVGAGASGCEIASAYRRRGVEVLLIESSARILPAEDDEIGLAVEQSFERRGIEISTSSSVSEVTESSGAVTISFGDEIAEVDYLCSATGRAPNTTGLSLQAAGVVLDVLDMIEVDPNRRTSNPKVLAIGDLVGPKALAHKASLEGVVAAEGAAGAQAQPFGQDLLAGAVFCDPQVASVGLTEASAIGAGHEVEVIKRPVGSDDVGAAIEERGFVKLVIDAERRALLGAHAVGGGAAKSIVELVVAMEVLGRHGSERIEVPSL